VILAGPGGRDAVHIIKSDRLQDVVVILAGLGIRTLPSCTQYVKGLALL